MKNRVHNISVLILAMFVLLTGGSITAKAEGNAGSTQEYQIKAAFLYNFVRFVDWPNEQTADGNEPISIGIVGNDPFGNAFESLKDKTVKGRKVIINRFRSFADLEKSDSQNESQKQIEAIRRCHLLFISSSEKSKMNEIIKLLNSSPVLTIGETCGLLKAGGIIRLLMEDKKVRFEINLDAAERVNLKVSSQLLRLAKKVVKDHTVSACGLDNNKRRMQSAVDCRGLLCL